MARRIALLVTLFLLVTLRSNDVAATVTQVDGTIIPVLTGGGCEGGNLQACFNDAVPLGEGVSPPAANAIYAILDAAELPEIFLPSTTSVVTFRDVAEGAGYENSFGYYNVGDDPTNTANLHPIMGCGVPATTHTGEVPNYVESAERGSTATVDFALERTQMRYRGGYIAFYLMTPEGGSPNCGDFAGSSFRGRTYFTERDLNNDGDFVHHLVYQSRIAADRFYFGFEDLFRGGDNDYEDMAMQITGLVPPCIPTAETCDTRDNDCDTRIDEGTGGVACNCNGSGGLTCEGGNRQGACVTGATACVTGTLVCRSSVIPVGETCNNVDDNCNGMVDDSPSGVGAPCDGTDTDLCNEGATACTAGVITCGDTTGPNDELCNGVNDDCDMFTDETPVGVGVACDGADSDLCNEGTTTCTTGSLRCSDATGNNVELCNGANDDCDGLTDESPTDVGIACSVGIGTCARNGATVCMAGAPRCNATPGAGAAERCNALDDDCDGVADETFMLGSACVAPGECGPGVLECASATATRCSSGPGGSMSGAMAEACNLLDDDCDATVDEGLTDLGACGSGVGECAQGRLQCVAGASTCVGGIGPTPEICNLRDDDCDGPADERGTGGLTDEGDACGTDTGECEPGTEICTAGALVCTGRVDGSAELCNALDDDCDGVVDDDPSDDDTVCGTTDVGVCDLGRTICTGGMLTCNGATEPTSEVCNGLDDDCDGTDDDDPIDVGRTCGSAMGTCTPGTTICVGGSVECEGATLGVPEVCNGIDDDCDTIIDDDPSDAGGACGMSEGVCEEGMIRCIAGELECVGGVLPGTEVCNGLNDDCDTVIDEGDLCEGGECRDGMCSSPCMPGEFPCAPGYLCVEGFCLEDACNDVTCTPTSEGEATRCDDGVCVPVCDTVACTAPSVCRPRDGACVANNCIFLPEMCSGAEVCVEGTCVADPCDGVACGVEEFCREGDCVGSCAGVECAATERCTGGDCVATGCAMACPARTVCDADSGDCVVDPCIALRCDAGEVCDPSAGACIDDPCRNITCPTGELCSLGECDDPPPATPDGGVLMDAGSDRVDVLAAGSPVCSARPGTGGGVWSLGLFVMLAVALRRLGRRRARALATIGLGAVLVAISGCSVDPYCLEGCEHTIDGGAPIDARAVDGRADTPPERPEACVLGAVELCNGFDDDCDRRTDEDFDLDTDRHNCGGCAVDCDRDGARTTCEDGVCTFGACFDGFVDVDGDPDNGCEYHCFESNGGVEVCDTLDNDCDGEPDEDFDFDGDEMNCGRCGQECRFFRVVGATCETGVCRFDSATDCEPGYLDRDGLVENGCEFECTPTGVEVCNGLDDDCDAHADEDFDLDTSITDCGRCGRACTFPHATPSCTLGTCGFDPNTDCEPGFSDENGVQLDGCEYPCVPTADPTEICDGIDNDCNGTVDGPTTDSGSTCSNAPGGTARGICTATGTVTCIGGALDCVGAPEPATERCNGMDDDCDGTTDDSPVDVGRVCLPATGVCSAGFSTCSGGTLGCTRAVGPSAERCNGLDDDCDGLVDDAPTDASLGTSCGISTGACATGTRACVGGSILCQGGIDPVLETCNGVDDDCDGTADDDPIDEGGSCGSGVGACVPGSLACSGGTLSCSGGVGSSTEMCDNQDDDCDGTTDEGISASCYTGLPATRGRGICRDGTSTCSAGTMSACGGQILPTVETCDNRNEDCDTLVDEGVTRSCYRFPTGTPGVGICRNGTEACTAGVFSTTCTGAIGPAAEACDNVDQDCDGRTDEASLGVPLTTSCYSGTAGTAGVGTCRSGTRTCSVGAFGACTGEIVPAREWCGDGLNTDCDPLLTDAAEGCLAAGTELRLDGPATGAGMGEETAPGGAHSFDVQVASAGTNVYVAWSDLRNGASDIFFMRSADGGATFGTIVNLTPDVAVGMILAHGDRAVQPVLYAAGTAVYVGFQRVNGGIRHVRLARSTDSGVTFATSGDLDTTGATDNFKHAIAASADGTRVVVAWESLSTGDLTRRIRARASTDSGLTMAAERVVNGGATPNAGKPRVVVTSSGRFVFVWRERRAPRTTFDVYANFSDDTTTALPAGTELRIDADTGDNRDSDDFRIAGDGDHVFLAYSDLSTVTTGDSDLVVVRSTTNGATWGTPIIVDDPALEVSSSETPALAIDPGVVGTGGDERVYVAWRDTREGTQIYLSRSDDSGATYGAPIRASNAMGGPVSGVVSSPRIAFAGSDTIIIAYTNGPAGSTVVRTASSPDRGVSWSLTDPTLNTVTRNSDMPAIAPFTAGATPTLGAVVAWIDYRTSPFANGDVYRVRVGR